MSILVPCGIACPLGCTDVNTYRSHHVHLGTRRIVAVHYRVDSTPSPLTKVFTKDFDSAAEAEVAGFLDKIEATKNQLFGELSGPYLFGEFSIADIMVRPQRVCVLQIADRHATETRFAAVLYCVQHADFDCSTILASTHAPMPAPSLACDSFGFQLCILFIMGLPLQLVLAAYPAMVFQAC